MTMKSELSRSEKPAAEIPNFSISIPEADMRRLANMQDCDILITDEHPEIDPESMANGVTRVNMGPPPPKVDVALRIDEDVLSWFQRREPEYYKTLINVALREYYNELRQ